MKKFVAMFCLSILSLINVLVAQTNWDNSACLYQSNKTNLLLREEISTGTIIFFEVNNQLFLEKFTSTGSPILDEAFNVGIGNSEQGPFNITKSDDNNFLIYWREDNSLKVSKITEAGTEVWNSTLDISLINYADQSIYESQIVVEEGLAHLLINFSNDDYENSLVHYQIETSSSSPQLENEALIYEAYNLVSFTGEVTSDGLNLMWLQPSAGILNVMRGEIIYQIDDINGWDDTPWGEFSLYKKGKIVEINAEKTIYALLSKNFYASQRNNRGLFIYNEIDSTFTNIELDSAIIDIQKISETEFLTVNMTDTSNFFNRYDLVGELISTTEINHSFGAIFDGWDFIIDEIRSIDSKLEDDQYKLAIATLNYSSYEHKYRPSLIVFDYNLENASCLSIANIIPQSDYLDNSAVFVHLGESEVSLLNKLNFGTYSAYKQYYSPYINTSQVTVNPYEICKTYPHKVSKLNSFSWNGSNQVLMKYTGIIYEVAVSENAEIETAMLTEEFTYPIISQYRLHKVFDNKYLFHYSWEDYHSHEYQRLKVYNTDGSSSFTNLVSSDYHLNSISSLNDGDGWFAYSIDNFMFHRIEDTIFQTDFSEPIEDRELLAIEGNYLILRASNQFRLTEIDNNGEIVEGGLAGGFVFTSEYDFSSDNVSLNSYEDKLIFSYHTDGLYKIFVINPQDLSATVSYSLESCELPTYDHKDNNRKTEFVMGNKFYFIDNLNGNLNMTCFDLANDFAQVCQTNIAENVMSDFVIEKLNNRFVVAYTQGTEGSERVYLRTISFLGNSDQYEEGYALPLNLESQYGPTISVLDDNTIFVNRIENNSADNPGVYCDLIDLSYFVPNSSEDVSPLTFSASNYPNPFNPETTISYNLTKAGVTKVEVFNLKGQLVKTLVNEVQAQGNQKVIWRGNNNQDKQVSSGIYLYKIKNTGGVISGKMVLMK